jgi:cullin-4
MFLEQTAVFYAREGDDLSVALTPFEYGAHCETRLREELNLCDDALDASTKKTCARVVAKHLVEKHLQRMLDEGFTKAFKENRVGDIARFFQLAKRCGGGKGGGGHETLSKTTKDQREALASTLTDASNSSTKFVDAVRRAFGVSLRSLGTEIVKDEQREKDMVMRLLTLKSLADDAVHRAFESGETFVATNREAFEHFVNQRGNKPPELIAKFVDSKLRASSAKAAGTSENDSSSFVAIDHDAETEKSTGRRLVSVPARAGQRRVRGVLQAGPRETVAPREIRERRRGEVVHRKAQSGVRRAVHGEVGGYVQGCRRVKRLDARV